MSGEMNRYGWASYYAAAYEKERKNNIVLAGKIADAQRRQTDLNDNLNRIYSNPFWKMTAPFRKLYHSVKGTAPRGRDKDRCSEENPCLLRYAEELTRQKHPYAEWIRENDSDSYITGVLNQDKVVKGWQVIKIPESDIVLLTYGKGILNGNTFDVIKLYFNNNRVCKIAYADEDFYWDELSRRMQPWFKPVYSPDTMLAFNYWGHLVAVKSDLLSEILADGEIKNNKERLKQSHFFYDLCLRLEEAVHKHCLVEDASARECICHIDAVLYHNAYEPPAKILHDIEMLKTPEEKKDVVEQSLITELEAGRYLTGAGTECVPIREAALSRRGIKGSLMNGQEPELYHVIYDTSISGAERCARAISGDRYTAPYHVVSVVIPSKDHPQVLERCLKSFREKTDYRYYEWIVVDNGSNAENRTAMEALSRKYDFKYIYKEMPFNFSAMCNIGAAQAKGDLLLFMNDDIEIIEQSWLRRMAGQALQPHTGAVGAKLWYANTQNIQHAGITNMQIGPSHKLVTFSDDKDYYYGHNRITYDMIGVTAACMMVSREKYGEVGGMDESMAVSYNDVDLCFKLIEAGYYNVQRNDAVLYHYESLSRGLDEQDAGKWERLLAEKDNLYGKHPQMKGTDIFYHRALIDNASDYVCNYKFPHEQHLLTSAVEPLDDGMTKGLNTNRLRLTVDRAEIQHKIHADEPDILWIMGWCYVPRENNARYDKRVLLVRADSGDDAGYMAVPSDWNRKDVEAILPMECNVGLAGFVLRVLRKDLEAGIYRIGMLCTNEQGDKQLAWSDKACSV